MHTRTVKIAGFHACESIFGGPTSGSRSTVCTKACTVFGGKDMAVTNKKLNKTTAPHTSALEKV